MPLGDPTYAPRRRAQAPRSRRPPAAPSRRLLAVLFSLACLLGILGLEDRPGAHGGQPVRGLTASASGLSLITEPEAGIGPVLTLIEQARHRVLMTIYEMTDTRVQAALAADAARGVRVRVLLGRPWDSDGNTQTLAYLRAHGVAARYGPPRFALTHQKSLEIDGAAALVMTFNLTPRYYAGDRDFAILDRRPSDVAAIEGAFGQDWRDAGHTHGSDGDLLWSPGASPRLLGLIAAARHTLQIESEELSDPAIAQALCAAVARGVRVQATVTYEPSARVSLARLAHCGVEVHAYRQDARLYIHAKAIVADRRIAFVGSQNLSTQSLGYNRELGIAFSARPLVRALARTLSTDFASAYSTARR